MFSCFTKQLLPGNWNPDEEKSCYPNSSLPGNHWCWSIISQHVHHAYLEKRQCHEIFGIFFLSSLIQPIWVPDKQKIFAKNVTPCSVILCRVGLRAVSHCAASGNWNVRKIQNCLTLRSQTPCSFSTASSQTIFLFSKTSISMSFRIYVKIFRKKFEKISKIQKWLTLRAVWYCAESESAQYGTARSQLLKFTADPKV